MPDAPSDHNAHTKNTNDSSTPRWVKIFAAVGLALVLLFIILHLVGGGLGHHAP